MTSEHPVILIPRRAACEARNREKRATRLQLDLATCRALPPNGFCGRVELTLVVCIRFVMVGAADRYAARDDIQRSPPIAQTRRHDESVTSAALPVGVKLPHNLQRDAEPAATLEQQDRQP